MSYLLNSLTGVALSLGMCCLVAVLYTGGTPLISTQSLSIWQHLVPSWIGGVIS